MLCKYTTNLLIKSGNNDIKIFSSKNPIYFLVENIYCKPNFLKNI